MIVLAISFRHYLPDPAAIIISDCFNFSPIRDFTSPAWDRDTTIRFFIGYWLFSLRFLSSKNDETKILKTIKTWKIEIGNYRIIILPL